MTNEQLSEHLRELALSTGNTDYADALERAANLLDRADEPVAMRGDFDGNGYRYIDNGSGSDWKQRHPDWEALYSAPIDNVETERLDWLIKRLSRRELRKLNLIVPEPTPEWVRLAIDAEMARAARDFDRQTSYI